MSNGSDQYDGPSAPSGFSFQPGELIPLAPDIFPGEAELIQLSEMAMQYGGGWVSVVGAVIFIILELINELVSLFTGKPREEDTLTVAARLSQSKNPAGHLASMLIRRELSDEDVVLSASDPFGQKRVNDTRHQMVMSLVAQGVPITRAKTLAGNIWGNTTSSVQPLPKELMQPLDPKFTLIGPPAIQNLYVEKYNSLIEQGKDPLFAAQKATKEVYHHGRIKDLLSIQTRLRPIGTPPPPTCPAGQHWDATVNACVPDTTTIPPPPPPDPNGDELTDCCNLTATYLYEIAVAISNFSPGGGMDSGCCDKVVAAINAVADKLASAGGAPGDVNITVDTTAIADAIAKLSIPAPVVNVTVDASGAADPNVKRIADVLDGTAGPPDDTEDFIRQMNRDGLLALDLAQLILV